MLDKLFIDRLDILKFQFGQVLCLLSIKDHSSSHNDSCNNNGIQEDSAAKTILHPGNWDLKEKQYGNQSTR